MTLPPSSGGVTAIKFRDPEGHPLELLCFPDTADTHWRGSGMLGVDHSAIVVRNLAASKAFYLAHGLTAGTTTLNQGAAQAVLDDLEDPIADVVAMMPQFGRSHVELLHYRQPENPASAPYSVNDVAATRIVWRGNNAALLRPSASCPNKNQRCTLSTTGGAVEVPPGRRKPPPTTVRR